jgi:hypothetical protein
MGLEGEELLTGKFMASKVHNEKSKKILNEEQTTTKELGKKKKIVKGKKNKNLKKLNRPIKKKYQSKLNYKPMKGRACSLKI